MASSQQPQSTVLLSSDDLDQQPSQEFQQQPSTSQQPQQLVVKNVLPTSTGLFAITIDNVFSKDECLALIKMAEDKGYEPALVNVGGGNQELMTDFRNNDRCIIDSEDYADQIYQRVKQSFQLNSTMVTLLRSTNVYGSSGTIPVNNLNPIMMGLMSEIVAQKRDMHHF